MTEFYYMVHDLTYNHYNLSKQRYISRILNELRILNKPKNYLKNKIVLDIGTGFQSIAALELGAKKVIHIDFNEKQIIEIKKIQKEYNIKNIKSFRFDLNKDNYKKIPLFDVAVVFGIINHVTNPHQVLKKLKNRLKPNGELLIRCYDGNTATRKIINQLRCYKGSSKIPDISKFYKRKFGSKTEKSLHFRDMLDDLYFDIVKDFSLNKKIKRYNSNIKNDENLRFIIKQNTHDDVINEGLIINKPKKLITLPLVNDLEFIVNSYTLIRNFKYIDCNNEIKLLQTSYTQNDYLKTIKYNFLKLLRILKCKLNMHI